MILNMPKILLLTTALTPFLTVFATKALAVVPSTQVRQSPETFNIAGEPSNTDWKYFLGASTKFRESLWNYNVQRQKQLKDWSWQWRLGWLRACSNSVDAYCAKIFESALIDKAVVVRADAATRIGVRFEKTGNLWATTQLALAYKNPKNIRNGTPLYIQQRILFSLKQIGGTNALSTGGKTAKSHKGSATYWEKLNRG